MRDNGSTRRRGRGGRPLKRLDPNGHGRRRFGAALRAARRAVPGLTQQGLAELLSAALGQRIGRSYVTKLELGEVFPTAELASAADDCLDAGGSLRAAWQQAAQEEHEQAERDRLRAQAPVSLAGWEVERQLDTILAGLASSVAIGAGELRMLRGQLLSLLAQARATPASPPDRLRVLA